MTVPSPLTGRTFVTGFVTDQDVRRRLAPGTWLRLGFPAGLVTAHAGCNAMSAGVRVGPDRLEVGPIASTLMGCEPVREEQDRLVADLLAAGPQWQLDTAGLTLHTDDLRFELVEEPTQLWGHRFVAVAVNETGIVPAPVVAGTDIVLTFTAPDGLTGHAGCNALIAQVDVTEDRLMVGDRVGSTRVGCPAELHRQDEWLIAFLQDDPAFTLDEGVLTLRRASTEIVLVPMSARD
ncbi:hypothetical protein BJF78_02180 [Pseudonocardia sp. CNS-139]|nr:hypothetical protein BJF78_02180 [Pseudonocardia sp. CNS-139]